MSGIDTTSEYNNVCLYSDWLVGADYALNGDP